MVIKTEDNCFENEDKLSLFCMQGWIHLCKVLIEVIPFMVPMKIAIISRIKWATSRENVSSEIFDKVRFKPACSATEAS